MIEQEISEEQRYRSGKRWARYVLIGFGLHFVTPILENWTIIPSGVYWLLSLGPVLAIFAYHLVKAEFKIEDVSFFSKKLANKSAFDEDGNVKIGPRIGMIFSFLLIAFLAFGAVGPLAVMGVNYLPSGADKEFVTYTVKKSEADSYSRIVFACPGGGQDDYIRFNGGGLWYSDRITFKQRKGLLGFPVVLKITG